MGATTNYNLPLPDPNGIQRAEIQNVRDALVALDAALKALSLAKAPDADKLDGNDSSFFTAIVDRLGYTPLDTAGGTMTGEITSAVEATDVPGHTFRDLVNNTFGAIDVANEQLRLFGAYRGGVPSVWSWITLQDGIHHFAVTPRVGTGGSFYDVWHAGNFDPALKLDVAAAYTRTMAAADISAAINNLINGAPGALDALNELAAAIGNDPNFAATISAQIGTKLNAAAYTATDVRAKLLTVDGAGSGIDADLLDGKDGTYYADVVARLGFTPLDRAGGSTTGQVSFNGDGATGIDDITGFRGPAIFNGINNPAAAARIAFQRAGSYAVYFGLHTNNKLCVGGWSMGGVAYEITHDGNINAKLGAMPLGAVGTEGFFRCDVAFAAGEIIAGSHLKWASVQNSSGTSDNNTNPSGNWIALGASNGGVNQLSSFRRVL